MYEPCETGRPIRKIRRCDDVLFEESPVWVAGEGRWKKECAMCILQTLLVVIGWVIRDSGSVEAGSVPSRSAVGAS